MKKSIFITLLALSALFAKAQTNRYLKMSDTLTATPPTIVTKSYLEKHAFILNPSNFQNGNISMTGAVNIKTDGQGTFSFYGNRWTNNTLGSSIALGGTIIYSSAYNHEFFAGDTRIISLAAGHLFINNNPGQGENPSGGGFTLLIRSGFDGEVRQISLAELKTLLNSQ